MIALTTVVIGDLFVEGGWRPPWIVAGLLVGVVTGLLVVGAGHRVQLPPFIATLGTMGIWRGTAFIITEGRFFDRVREAAARLAAAGHFDRLAGHRS